MSAASVLIVGAGVVGASVAYHLAVRGWPDVLVVDRASEPGAGSTGRATGGFRAQFATAVNVRLSLLAREKLRHFEDEVGGDAGYEPVGYLWVATTDAELAALRAAREVQHAEGLREAVELGARDIRAVNPALDIDHVVGGAFCPTDGFIRPLGILAGYLAAARRLGARVEWGVDITGFRRGDDGRIVAVRTSQGEISAGAVVNAAGPWAADVARQAGVDLPVLPLRRQVAATVLCDLLPASMPMSIFVGDGFHLRVRDGRVLLLMPSPDTPDRFADERVDLEWIRAVTDVARRRVPRLAGTEVDVGASWSGLYEMSPDKHAILGAAAECDNFYFANGSSGHGVMHAPALGQLLAEIISDGEASSLDVRPLRPSRFADGTALAARELL